MSLPNPPSRMGYFTAKAYTKEGWSIRRVPWRKIYGFTPDGYIANDGDSQLKWIRYEPRKEDWWIKAGTGDVSDVNYDRICLSTDVTVDDKAMSDWTCDPPDGISTTPGDPGSNPYTDPNGSLRITGSEGGGSSSSNGSGGSGVPDNGGPYVVVGGSGVAPGGVAPRPEDPRTAPALTISAVIPGRTACIPLLQTADLEFDANIDFAADPRALPGEIWILQVSYLTTRGITHMAPGTIKPGDTGVGIGPMNIPNVGGGRGAFKMFVTAHLNNPNLTANASASLPVPAVCACGDGFHYDPATNGCAPDGGGDIVCPDGWVWNPDAATCELAG